MPEEYTMMHVDRYLSSPAVYPGAYEPSPGKEAALKKSLTAK